MQRGAPSLSHGAAPHSAAAGWHFAPILQPIDWALGGGLLQKGIERPLIFTAAPFRFCFHWSSQQFTAIAVDYRTGSCNQ